MIKRTDSADNWSMTDNKRATSNPRDESLFPNLDSVELTAGYSVNYLSNGFQIATSGGGVNANGGTFLYIAFAADQSAAPVLADSFANKTYSGNSSTQSITGLGFSPNFSWIKVRNNTYVHGLYDTMRGALQRLRSNGTNANENVPNSLTSFDSDGFTLGSDIGQNQTGMNYVAWNWKANPIPTINTDGTIQSVVSANQAAGFSIVQYTAAAAGSSGTIGHGLSQAPEVIITKRTDAISAWRVGLEALGNWDRYLGLSQTNAYSTSSTIYSAAPTSSVYSIGNDPSMINDTIAYCFHSVSGFSKFGSYSGSGASGNAQNVGFAPGLVILKSTNAVTSWAMFDTARGANVLYSNLSNAESSDNRVTLTSTGFEFTGAAYNESGRDWVYMAFKENPTPRPLAGNMSFLVVAGGAGGGSGLAGGGGAGGLRTSYGGTSGGGSSAESDITLAAGTYTITVGAGAASASSGLSYQGNDGNTSSVTGNSNITVSGGGGGGSFKNCPTKNSHGDTNNGRAGGSGGGGGYTNVNFGTGCPVSERSSVGGAGTSNQGFVGGGSPGNAQNHTFGPGGGGGAAAAGTNGTTTGYRGGGPGGSGLSVAITGSAVYYAGGGGGGSEGVAGAAGGNGGGGQGGGTGGTTPVAGSTNTGGGGGGNGSTSSTTPGAGGSGVVILRLLTSEYSSSTTGSPTVTTDGDFTVLTYTGSGTYVHS
jgi:hypothetical protein